MMHRFRKHIRVPNTLQVEKITGDDITADNVQTDTLGLNDFLAQFDNENQTLLININGQEAATVLFGKTTYYKSSLYLAEDSVFNGFAATTNLAQDLSGLSGPLDTSVDLQGTGTLYLKEIHIVFSITNGSMCQAGWGKSNSALTNGISISYVNTDGGDPIYLVDTISPITTNHELCRYFQTEYFNEEGPGNSTIKYSTNYQIPIAIEEGGTYTWHLGVDDYTSNSVNSLYVDLYYYR